MPDVTMVVNDREYGGWKSLRVTRTIESIAGSFALEVSDRWGGQDEVWPIFEEDVCQVKIGNTVVIDGYVDGRSLAITETTRTLSYTGRDKAAVLVDCSAVVAGAAEAKNKWTYYNVDVVELARKIAEPFGVPVSVQAGLVLAKDPKLVVHPGDTCFEVIARAAGLAGVIVVSDGAGGIVITRAGTARASALVQGFNVKAASVDYNGTDRFRRYLISSQVPGTDEASGDFTRVQGEAIDLGVKRTNRVLLVRPDKGYNTADAKRRADWEARTRAAKAETFNVTVKGWEQPNSKVLWPVNALVLAQIPAIGVSGDMLISQVDHVISSSGQDTQLRLVRPDAFLPDIKATVSDPSGLWKDIRTGGL